MKILITGGAGNVGSALCNKLAENLDDNIFVVDNLLTGSIKKVSKKENINFIKADVNNFNDISAIFFANKFDFVFHFAAVVGVKRTIENPLLVMNDIKGIENILNLCKNSGVKRVYYSSSSEVYGEPFEIPQNEKSTPLNSRLPYAIVKNLGEAFCKSYNQEFGLPYTIFRFFNTYGLNQSDDFVIPKFIRAALKNEAITLYGDGNQTRTFCYVNDNIETCTNIHYNNECINDTINIGSDVEITIKKLAEKIITLLNSKSEIIHLPALKEGDMTRRMPDTTKMKKILNRELISLDVGILKLAEQYKNED